jgi:hypothetical protein
MALSPITNKMTPEQAAGHMRPFRTGNRRGPLGWSECLRIGAARKLVGEIRTLESWESLPRDTSLRAIYFIDDKGPVVRWGDPATMASILPGNTHNHLVCDDELIDVKSGWIAVSRDGRISVNP